MRVTSILVMTMCCVLWPSLAAMLELKRAWTPLHVASTAAASNLTQDSPVLKRKAITMSSRPPSANALIPIVWLGCRKSNRSSPVGSGVVIYVDDNQYLVTAFHVAKDCNFAPLIRHSNKWNRINWNTVAVDQSNDIAVLKTDTVLAPRLPIQYGQVQNLIYGATGYALGFPTFPQPFPSNDLRVDHIVEVDDRPIPLAALVAANFSSDANSTYSAAYINAGFSGGAVVFPVGQNEWTIAGIITHFPNVPRPIYRDGKATKDYVLQHTGLVGYTPLKVVESTIRKAIATEKGKPSTNGN